MTNQVIRFFLCAIIVIASLVTLPIGGVQHAQDKQLPVFDRYQTPGIQNQSLPKYTPKKGENSTKIAKKFNVDKKKIRELNKLIPVKGKHGRNFYFLTPEKAILLPVFQLDGSPVKVNSAGFAIVVKKSTKANSAVASTRTQKERVEAKSKPTPVKPFVSSGVKKPKKQTPEQIAAADRLRRYRAQQRRGAQQAKRDATVAKNMPAVEMVTKEKFDALEKRNKELQADLDKQKVEVKRLNELVKNAPTPPAPVATVVVTQQRNSGKVALVFSLLLVGLCGLSGFLTRTPTNEDNRLDESFTELKKAPATFNEDECLNNAKKVAEQKFFDLNDRYPEVFDREEIYDVLLTADVHLGPLDYRLSREPAKKLVFQAYTGAEKIGNADNSDGDPIFVYCLPNGTIIKIIGEPEEVLRLSSPPSSKREEVRVDSTSAKTEFFEEPKGLGKSGNMAREMYIPPAPDTVVNASAPTIFDRSAQGAPTVSMVPPPPTPPRPMIVRPKEGALTQKIGSAVTNGGTPPPATVESHPSVK